MKPFDPRLLKAAGQTRYFLAATVAIALIATVSTLFVAYGLSQFVVQVFSYGQSAEQAGHFLAIALAAGLVRAIALYLGEVLGFRIARGVKLVFRNLALNRISRGELNSDPGAMSQLLGPGLDSLDNYFGKFLPQLVFTVVVTPIFILVIFLLDPISAVSILLTLPLIPIFMVLIGLVTKDVQSAQLQASLALSSHFLEVLQGITTLKIFGRLEKQLQVLQEVSREQKRRTMKVLRLSFLSGFALELAASLSVALIAVQIGLRLVDGGMLLATGLFVLLLAPEVYLPLRNVGAQFHNSQAGVAATGQLLDLIAKSAEPRLDPPTVDAGITVYTGVSGSGKTSLLRTLIGKDSAWMPQQVQLLRGTIAQNIAGFGEVDHELVTDLLQRVGLQEVDPNLQVTGTQGLSGGQAQRIMLARALYRVKTKNLNRLVLDEPTSMLDVENQDLVAKLLLEVAGEGVSIVIATHQDSLVAIADRQISLEASRV